MRVLQLPAGGLDGLAEAVRAATIALVPEPEQGEPPFNGHLTLARAKGRLGAAAQAELAGIPFASRFAVDAVDLVASEPSPTGHVYSTLVRAPLGRRAVTQAGWPVRNSVTAWAMAAAAACWKAGVTSSAASVALRMLPHSMSTLGTVVRFRPARSFRGCRPATPS